MVINKINSLEGAFRRAHDFANHETGAGKTAKDTGKSFEDCVMGVFKYYYVLAEVMADRASGRATLNTDNPEDLELTTDQRESLAKSGNESEDDGVADDEDDNDNEEVADGDYVGDDYSSPPFPVLEGAGTNPPTDARIAQWDGEMGHQPIYTPMMPLNVPLAASVAPTDLFNHASDSDNDESGMNQGKRSAPAVAVEDYGKKPKVKLQ
jgi:hypothetical protein